MKIFLSHSSQNKNYGNALVDLLIGVGISAEDIIFTSNDAYGIPTGQNIFSWLKARINEKPYVVYLLSPEYYTSVACLNEMGAAWVVENEHTMIFTPNFKLNSYEFQNGALDPREIGFYINNEDRLIAFIESLKKSFPISNNPVLVNQKVRAFLTAIFPFSKNQAQTVETAEHKSIVQVEEEFNQATITNIEKSNLPVESKEYSRFVADVVGDKFKDEEILLLHYIIDRGTIRLRTGWQEGAEISNIKAWEDIRELNNTLSHNYPNVLKRFEMRNMVEVSEVTSYGNPKEVRLIQQIQEQLIDPPKEVLQKILEVVNKNLNVDLSF